MAENPDNDWWITTDSQFCQLWNPDPLSGGLVNWSGSCVGGKASGEGPLVWHSNYDEGEKVYEGIIFAGKIHGLGTLTVPDGSC